MSQDEYKPFPNACLDDIDNNYLRPILTDVMEEGSYKDIMDCGCGNGLFGSTLLEFQGVRLTGVDASPYGLEQAKCRGYHELAQVDDLCESRLPFEDDSFDLVMFKDVLEHLSAPRQTLLEIARTLKPGGALFIQIPNHFSLRHRIKFLFTNRLDTQNFYPNTPAWELPHIRFLRHDELSQLLHGLGFELYKDYSDFYATLFPGAGLSKPGRDLAASLARRWPNNFALAFASVWRKTKDTPR